jgi:protein-S-isoprenylcysteine O-methyltransferase Ste14
VSRAIPDDRDVAGTSLHFIYLILLDMGSGRAAPGTLYNRFLRPIEVCHHNVPMLLHGIGWLACVIYATIPPFWLMIHPRVEYWRSRQGSPYRVLVPLWIGMWVVLGLITTPWRDLSLYKTAWTWVPAALLLATGLWVYQCSGAGFSPAQLGGVPELIPGHGAQRLVTTGIRMRIRHPVYLGHLCEMLAWSVGTGLAVCYALTVLALVTGAVMIRLEDRELERRFGEEYRQYKRKTPAILPRGL